MSYHSPDTLHEAILQTIAYADVFDYPLSPSEIYRYLIGRDSETSLVNEALHNGLLSHRLLETREGLFYMPGRSDLIDQRKQRSVHADMLWGQAIRYGRWIARLPFVRMVALTGALANRNIDQDADLDYLIITKPGFLWLCRAFILLLTRVTAPFGARICPNYLLTSDVMKLDEQDLFTAQELCRMIPIYGQEVYEQFRDLNRWSDQFLPNAQSAPSYEYVYVPSFIPLKTALEWLLSQPPGQWLEQLEMRRKIEKLSAQSPHNPEVHFSADRCKGHFELHGTRTLAAYRARVKQLLNLSS